MKKATDLQVLMIAAIRADADVGRGSRSVIASYGDAQLLELLNRKGATDPAHAVQIAHEEQQRHECSEKKWEMADG